MSTGGRRALLRGLGSVAALWLVRGLTGCGPGRSPSSTKPGEAEVPDADSGGPRCVVEPGPAEEGWVELSLADHPALREPGGWAVVEVPDALLYVIVACTAPDCWVALWSTCTHGACGVQWDAAAVEARCPCHGSRFAADGAVVQGPATRPLSSFPVGRRGDSLWVHRPV